MSWLVEPHPPHPDKFPKTAFLVSELGKQYMAHKLAAIGVNTIYDFDCLLQTSAVKQLKVTVAKRRLEDAKDALARAESEVYSV